MKFALALLAFTQVQATEISTEAEWSGYGGYGNYGNHGYAARTTIARAYVPTMHYNGHGHHSYSDHSSSDYSSYDSYDYSSSDHGYGYRMMNNRHRYMRYTPRYNSGRYYYGNRYASHSGHYKASYRSYPARSYSACMGACARPASYGHAW